MPPPAARCTKTPVTPRRYLAPETWRADYAGAGAH